MKKTELLAIVASSAKLDPDNFNNTQIATFLVITPQTVGQWPDVITKRVLVNVDGCYRKQGKRTPPEIVKAMRE